MGGAGQPHQSTRDTQGRVGFEAASDVYERGRPGYQPDLVAFVVDRAGIQEGTRVLDLAAGTGKFTRELLPFGATCMAIEPSASMREMLSRLVPGVPVMAGVGEAIPLEADPKRYQSQVKITFQPQHDRDRKAPTGDQAVQQKMPEKRERARG